MFTYNIEKLYQQIIKPLMPDEKLLLIEFIVHDLVKQPDKTSKSPKRSIMELHGLGKEIWKDVDVEKYIDHLREEWERSL